MSSRADGSYTLPNLEPGRYSVVFEKTGFTRSEAPNILVVVGQATTVDVGLQVGAVQEMVEVSAAALAIDTSSTMICTTSRSRNSTHYPRPVISPASLFFLHR